MVSNTGLEKDILDALELVDTAANIIVTNCSIDLALIYPDSNPLPSIANTKIAWEELRFTTSWHITTIS